MRYLRSKKVRWISLLVMGVVLGLFLASATLAQGNNPGAEDAAYGPEGPPGAAGTTATGPEQTLDNNVDSPSAWAPVELGAKNGPSGPPNTTATNPEQTLDNNAGSRPARAPVELGAKNGPPGNDAGAAEAPSAPLSQNDLGG